MKLFRVEVMDDCEIETVLAVAKSEAEAIDKVRQLDWACYMFEVSVDVVDEVDGYKIMLQKVAPTRAPGLSWREFTAGRA